MIRGSTVAFIDHPYLKILYPHMGPPTTPGAQAPQSKPSVDLTHNTQEVSAGYDVVLPLIFLEWLGSTGIQQVLSNSIGLMTLSFYDWLEFI